jgi:death on curing protein
MRDEPYFISLEEALFFHAEELKCAGGAEGLRDPEGLKAAIAAPQAAFGDSYLMDLFQMAASYVESICARHPFVDGNKRAGAACALTFLFLNGYEIDEQYDEELADRVLDLVTHRIGRQGLADYLRDRSRMIS